MDPDSRPGPATAGPLHIILADKTWRRLVPRAETLIRRAAKAADTSLSLGEKALDAGTTGPHPKERTVLLTSDPEIRRLNRTYRGKDKPTNVLTFESGDIALACGTIRREAAAAGKPVAHHLAHLVVHGALHLRGHDHAGAGEARRMEMAEARALHRLRVPNPWRPR